MKFWYGAALAAALASGPATAATITFENLPAGNPPVTSYSEDGLTFTATSGTFYGTTGNGVPPPSVYTPNGSGTAEITGTGLYNFTSVALGNGAFSGKAQFTVTGLLNGISQFSFNETVGSLQFNTYSSPSNSGVSIDTLRIAATGDANIDNIRLTSVPASSGAVPEPSSWALMIGGFGMVGNALRRTRRWIESFA